MWQPKTTFCSSFFIQEGREGGEWISHDSAYLKMKGNTVSCDIPEDTKGKDPKGGASKEGRKRAFALFDDGPHTSGEHFWVLKFAAVYCNVDAGFWIILFYTF